MSPGLVGTGHAGHRQRHAEPHAKLRRRDRGLHPAGARDLSRATDLQFELFYSMLVKLLFFLFVRGETQFLEEI